VQPTNPDSVPGRHLAEHGEGFFLISFQVDDVESASATLQERGGRLLQKAPRQGLDDWRVIDLDPADTFGAQMQFTESAADKAP
jgi:methylmalonyl-CoA/ethylmalonyl-CoA epimerase